MYRRGSTLRCKGGGGEQASESAHLPLDACLLATPSVRFYIDIHLTPIKHWPEPRILAHTRFPRRKCLGACGGGGGQLRGKVEKGARALSPRVRVLNNGRNWLRRCRIETSIGVVGAV